MRVLAEFLRASMGPKEALGYGDILLTPVQVGGCDNEEGTPFKGNLLGGTFQECITVCGPSCRSTSHKTGQFADSSPFPKDSTCAPVFAEGQELDPSLINCQR